MPFNSLGQVLATIEKQPGWEAQQQYDHLLECWQWVVGPQIAPETRPLYIARKVLWVATSSAVWAQTLSLQRYSFLEKLKSQLSEPLNDIRFSSAQWFSSKHVGASDRLQSTHQEHHPSTLSVVDKTFALLPDRGSGNTPKAALQRWTEAIRSRSQRLPLCPHCQSPSPPGELQRWNCCCHCAARQWAPEGRDKSEQNLS